MQSCRFLKQETLLYALSFCLCGCIKGVRRLAPCRCWIRNLCPDSLNCIPDSKTQESTSKKFSGFRNLYSLTWGETSQCARIKGFLMGRRRLQAGGWCGEGLGVLQETGKAADMLTSFQFLETSISSLISSFSRFLWSSVSTLRPVIYRLSMSFRYI